jgi:DNA polymerase-3 subunit beta
VFLSTTDTEVEAVEIVDAVAGAGISHVVDFKTLRAAVGTCKADDIAIDGRNPELLRIGLAVIPTIATADEFPALGVAGYSQTASVMIDAATLADCLAATISARDTESTRYALGGVFLEVGSGGGVRAIATDGRRLHVAESETATDTMVGSIIPGDCVSAVISAAGAVGGVVVEFFSKSGEGVRARFSMFRDSGEQCGEIVSRVVDGRFPNWQACFAKETLPFAEAPGVDLLRLVSSASQLVKLTGGEWRGVELSSVGGRLAVSSWPSCPVAFSDSIAATTPDAEAEPISLDCEYLREILAAAQCLAVSPIAIQFDASGACFIRAAGRRVSFRGVVMSLNNKR